MTCLGRLGQSELTQLPKLSTNAPPTSKLEANTCICTFNTFASSCLLSLATDSSVSHTDEQRGPHLFFLFAVTGHDSRSKHGAYVQRMASLSCCCHRSRQQQAAWCKCKGWLPFLFLSDCAVCDMFPILSLPSLLCVVSCEDRSLFLVVSYQDEQ